jgi:hypothetical protein
LASPTTHRIQKPPIPLSPDTRLGAGDGTHLKVKEFEHEPVFESETASSP